MLVGVHPTIPWHRSWGNPSFLPKVVCEPTQPRFGCVPWDCNRNKADVIESSFQRYFSGWNYVWFCCAAAARAAWFNSRPASKGSKEEPAGACQGQSIEPNMPLFPGYCADGQKRCWDKPISQRRGDHWSFIYLWKNLRLQHHCMSV